MQTTLDEARSGDHFQIKAGGKIYRYVGRTANGLYIYQDDNGVLYDRKIAQIKNFIKV